MTPDAFSARVNKLPKWARDYIHEVSTSFEPRRSRNLETVVADVLRLAATYGERRVGRPTLPAAERGCFSALGRPRLRAAGVSRPKPEYTPVRLRFRDAAYCAERLACRRLL